MKIWRWSQSSIISELHSLNILSRTCKSSYEGLCSSIDQLCEENIYANTCDLDVRRMTNTSTAKEILAARTRKYRVILILGVLLILAFLILFILTGVLFRYYKSIREEMSQMNDKSIEDTISQLKSNNKKIEKEIFQLKDTNIEDAISQLKSKDTNTEDAISQLKRKDTNIEDAISQLKSKDTNIEDAISQLKSKDTNTEDAISQLKSKDTNIEDSISQLKSKGTHIEDEISQLKSKDTNIEDSISQLKSKDTNIEDSISQLKNKDTNIEDSILQLKSKDTNIEDSISQLKNKDTNIEDSISQLKSKDTNIEDSISQLKSKDTNIEEAILQLKSKDTKIEDAISQLKSKEIKTEEEITQLKAYIANITDDLNKMKLIKNKENIQDSCTSCPSGWQLIKSNCYYFQANGETWTRSREECDNRKGIMLILKDKAELDSLLPTIRNEKYWLGLRRDSTNINRWLWADGSSLTFSPWNAGEPNNDKGQEHCAEILGREQSMNDRNCEDRIGYICEKAWTC
ncbi:uncharacterized protein [Aquarana catesbeiana]|uniref:uncharacterized protein isoform X3 n=1 Tax=Aquarana catesbeiana TaxID=8400 RepID=UPI003CC9DCA5